MSNDVYGATVILMAVASLVAIRVLRHRVHTDHICFVGFTTAIRRTIFQINDLGCGSSRPRLAGSVSC